MTSLFRSMVCFGLAALVSGCMTYRGFDGERLEEGAPAQRAESLRYSIDGASLFNGHSAIRQVLDKESGYAKVEQVTAQPPTGLYVKATVETVPPSIGAGVANYASYATLFLLPAWSTQDGAHAFFDLYRDGVHLHRYDYRIQRKTFVWLPMLPVAWVNVFTYDEDDAFEAVTKQFLADAAAQMSGQTSDQTKALTSRR